MLLLKYRNFINYSRNNYVFNYMHNIHKTNFFFKLINIITTLKYYNIAMISQVKC